MTPVAGALPQSHPSVRARHMRTVSCLSIEKRKVRTLRVKECKLKILSVNKQEG